MALCFVCEGFSFILWGRGVCWCSNAENLRQLLGIRHGILEFSAPVTTQPSVLSRSMRRPCCLSFIYCLSFTFKSSRRGACHARLLALTLNQGHARARLPLSEAPTPTVAVLAYFIATNRVSAVFSLQYVRSKHRARSALPRHASIRLKPLKETKAQRLRMISLKNIRPRPNKRTYGTKSPFAAPRVASPRVQQQNTPWFAFPMLQGGREDTQAAKEHRPTG